MLSYFSEWRRKRSQSFQLLESLCDWNIKKCPYLLDVITSSLGSPAYSRKLRYLPKIMKKPPNFMDASWWTVLVVVDDTTLRLCKRWLSNSLRTWKFTGKTQLLLFILYFLLPVSQAFSVSSKTGCLPSFLFFSLFFWQCLSLQGSFLRPSS